MLRVEDYLLKSGGPKVGRPCSVLTGLGNCRLLPIEVCVIELTIKYVEVRLFTFFRGFPRPLVGQSPEYSPGTPVISVQPNAIRQEVYHGFVSSVSSPPELRELLSRPVAVYLTERVLMGERENICQTSQR